MNDILDIEIILKKQKYHCIYNTGIIIIIILLISLYISCVYNYKSYYITNGTMIDGKIKLLVKIDDIPYIYNNKELKINNDFYRYRIEAISEELFVDELYNNYKNIYLRADGLNNIDNYVYEIKILKENKKIIEYLKEYL